MKKFMTALTATAMAASMAFASVVPAGAAPMVAPAAPAAALDVHKVQERIWIPNGNRMNSDHMRYSLGERNFGNGLEVIRDRNWRRDRDWRGNRHWRGHRDGHHYWRGHRGYRHWRRGYREHNGWWFPLAAFTAGAVIGNAISEPRVIYRSRGGSDHVEWCYNRYRSYRASDNTFQPYNGPRRQCYSPYD